MDGNDVVSLPGDVRCDCEFTSFHVVANNLASCLVVGKCAIEKSFLLKGASLPCTMHITVRRQQIQITQIEKDSPQVQIVVRFAEVYTRANGEQ